MRYALPAALLLAALTAACGKGDATGSKAVAQQEKPAVQLSESAKQSAQSLLNELNSTAKPIQSFEAETDQAAREIEFVLTMPQWAAPSEDKENMMDIILVDHNHREDILEAAVQKIKWQYKGPVGFDAIKKEACEECGIDEILRKVVRGYHNLERAGWDSRIFLQSAAEHFARTGAFPNDYNSLIHIGRATIGDAAAGAYFKDKDYKRAELWARLYALRFFLDPITEHEAKLLFGKDNDNYEETAIGVLTEAMDKNGKSREARELEVYVITGLFTIGREPPPVDHYLDVLRTAAPSIYKEDRENALRMVAARASLIFNVHRTAGNANTYLARLHRSAGAKTFRDALGKLAVYGDDAETGYRRIGLLTDVISTRSPNWESDPLQGALSLYNGNEMPYEKWRIGIDGLYDGVLASRPPTNVRIP